MPRVDEVSLMTTVGSRRRAPLKSTRRRDEMILRAAHFRATQTIWDLSRPVRTLPCLWRIVTLTARWP